MANTKMRMLTNFPSPHKMQKFILKYDRENHKISVVSANENFFLKIFNVQAMEKLKNENFQHKIFRKKANSFFLFYFTERDFLDAV
jgi:hypothetical protein